MHTYLLLLLHIMIISFILYRETLRDSLRDNKFKTKIYKSSYWIYYLLNWMSFFSLSLFFHSFFHIFLSSSFFINKNGIQVFNCSESITNNANYRSERKYWQWKFSFIFLEGKKKLFLMNNKVRFSRYNLWIKSMYWIRKKITSSKWQKEKLSRNVHVNMRGKLKPRMRKAKENCDFQWGKKTLQNEQNWANGRENETF